jgi:hypothetical protein
LLVIVKSSLVVIVGELLRWRAAVIICWLLLRAVIAIMPVIAVIGLHTRRAILPERYILLLPSCWLLPMLLFAEDS